MPVAKNIGYAGGKETSAMPSAMPVAKKRLLCR